MLEFLLGPVSQDYFLPYFPWECISEGLEGKQDTALLNQYSSVS